MVREVVFSVSHCDHIEAPVFPLQSTRNECGFDNVRQR